MKTIIEEAQEITNNDRQNDYGHPSEDFAATAKIWSVIIKRRYNIDIELKAEDVALMMIGLKLNRESNKHKRDNRVDMIGYVNTLEKILNPPSPTTTNLPDASTSNRGAVSLTNQSLIYVNDKKTIWYSDVISYDQIITSYCDINNLDENKWKDKIFSIAVYNPLTKFSRTVSKGEWIQVTEEMKINCYITNNA